MKFRNTIHPEFWEVALTEIEWVTNLFQGLLFGSGAIVVHKTFAYRSSYRWELQAEDHSCWLGTISFSDGDIIRFSELGHQARVAFAGNMLVRSIGRSDGDS